MTSFTSRTVGRAMGTSGRIQPRIRPITAPDPGQGSTGLELLDVEIEAPQGPEATPSRRRAASPDTPDLADAMPRRPAPSRGPELRSDAPRPEQPAPLREAIRERVESPPGRSIERTIHEPIERHEHVEVRAAVEAHASTPAREPTSREDTRSRATKPAGAREVVPSFRAQRLVEPLAFSFPTATSGAPATLDEVEVEVDMSPRVDETSEPTPSSRSDRRSAAPSRDGVGKSARKPDRRPLDLRSLDTRTQVPITGLAEPQAGWADSDRPLTPRARERGPSGPIVRVEIGRVELKGTPKPEAPAPAGIPKPEGFVSLKQYLRERGSSS